MRKLLTLLLLVATSAYATDTLHIQDDGTLINAQTIKFGLGKLQINGHTILPNDQIDNTSDLNKPVSTAQQAAINLKLSPNGDGHLLTGLTKTQVGLGNVQNVDQTNGSNITSGTIPVGRMPVYTGATSGSPGTAGILPAPAAGQQTYILRGDGVWATVASAGGGTVTNVAVTTANGVSGTVTNPTASAAITLTLGAITPASVSIAGTAGAGYIDMPPQASDPSAPSTNHIRLYTTGTDLRWRVNAGGVIDVTPPISGNHHYVLPPSSGDYIVSGPDATHLPALDGSNVTGVGADVTAALSGKQATSAKNAANGYAGLDSGGLLVTGQIPILAESKISGLTTDLAGKEDQSKKGVASGYAGLDSSGKVFLTTVPTVDIAHGGTNATTAAGARTSLFASLATGSGGKTLVINGAGTDVIATGLYRKVNVVNITASGTYTPTAGTTELFVEVQAGGGGGGGAVASASNASCGGGGGAGGHAAGWITTIAPSYSVSIGAAGTGGVGAGAATSGGDTDFAGIVTAQGGGAGSSLALGTSVAFAVQGGGGGANNGDILTASSSGTQGIRLSGTAALGGNGGASGVFGGSPSGISADANANSLGVGYGSGGAGAVAYTATSRTGGAGKPGLIRVTEYISTTAP